MEFSEREKGLVLSIIGKVEAQRRAGNETLPLMGFGGLFALLDQTEIDFCRGILKINPYDYGFKGSYIGEISLPRPGDLMAIHGQEYKLKGGDSKTIPIQYLPLLAWMGFSALNETMRRELGRHLLVFSGYRSPAYQLCLFLGRLKQKSWDFSRVLETTAMPGYSEHGDLDNTAVDFIPAEGVPDNGSLVEHFAGSQEFGWLTEKADQHNFRLSYPRDNQWGVVFEPAHWRFFVTGFAGRF